MEEGFYFFKRIVNKASSSIRPWRQTCPLTLNPFNAMLGPHPTDSYSRQQPAMPMQFVIQFFHPVFSHRRLLCQPLLLAFLMKEIS